MGKELLGSLQLNRIYQMNCLHGMKLMPDDSVSLICIDPPYNIGKDKRWDKWKTVDDYIKFMTSVFMECQRVLAPNGSFYWFHNDMTQIRKLMNAIDEHTDLEFKQFIIWDKYHGTPWNQLKAVVHSEENRNFPKLAEYCLFYTFKDETGLNAVLKKDGFYALQRYFKECRESIGWSYKKCDDYLGIKASYCYWDKPTTHPYRIPSKENYEKLKQTGHFPRDYGELESEYESLRNGYESLRKEYEDLRYTFNNQKTHPSVWQYPIPSPNGHVTPKPVELMKNIIMHSSNEGDIVLDCFMGSGTTAVACEVLNRRWIGFETEPKYIEIANMWLDNLEEGEK